MWPSAFKTYSIKINFLQSFGSKEWNWQLKLRNKYYKTTLYYKRCAVTNLFTPLPQKFIITTWYHARYQVSEQRRLRLRSSWVLKVLIGSFRRFCTAYCSHLSGPMKWKHYAVTKRRDIPTNHRRVILHTGEHLQPITLLSMRAALLWWFLW
jgi:hypothetical protein